MQISLITFFITGIIFAALALPLIKEKIKINNWYGIRIPQTMHDEKIWYEVNKKMGKYLFTLGISISGLSLYFFLRPTSPEYIMVYLLLAILIMGTIFLVILSYKTANKIILKNANKSRKS